MSTLHPRQHGFTLMEMVVSIAIAAVFVGFAGTLIRAPLDSYVAQSDRAKVLDAADAGWPRIERDIREALPNSARARTNGTIQALELLRVEGASRHITPVNGANITLATLLDEGLPEGVPLGGNIAVFSSSSVTPYQPNIMTPASSTLRLADGPTPQQHVLTITPAFAAASPSPKNYLYFVRAVTYLCDTRARTLVRYYGYRVSASQAARDTAAELNNNGATSDVIARNITSCRFSAPLPPLPITRGQTVTASFTATAGKESTTIVHQASLDVAR